MSPTGRAAPCPGPSSTGRPRAAMIPVHDPVLGWQSRVARVDATEQQRPTVGDKRAGGARVRPRVGDLRPRCAIPRPSVAEPGTARAGASEEDDPRARDVVRHGVAVPRRRTDVLALGPRCPVPLPRVTQHVWSRAAAEQDSSLTNRVVGQRGRPRRRARVLESSLQSGPSQIQVSPNRALPEAPPKRRTRCSPLS